MSVEGIYKRERIKVNRVLGVRLAGQEECGENRLLKAKHAVEGE